MTLSTDALYFHELMEEVFLQTNDFGEAFFWFLCNTDYLSDPRNITVLKVNWDIYKEEQTYIY